MINVNSLTTAHNPQTGFDLIRLSKSKELVDICCKELVDICSNTIRLNVNSLTTAHNPQTGFDLIRLSKSKELVDICSNTIRSYHRQGLPIYKQGKAAYVSKTELAQFIRQKRDTNLEVA